MGQKEFEALGFMIEYARKVDEIYGVYLDATFGFHIIKMRFEEDQIQSANQLDMTIEQLDKVRFHYGYGSGTTVDPKDILHSCMQGEYKQRNTLGGKNFVTLGHLCITQLYQYWEDFYRGKIAERLGLAKNEISGDIFGDLRLFRNSIIHHGGIALAEIKKCKILNWFQEGHSIDLTDEQIELIIKLVKDEMWLKMQNCP